MQKIKYIQNIVTLERRIINGTYVVNYLCGVIHKHYNRIIGNRLVTSCFCCFERLLLIVMCSKTEKLTDIGKWTFVFAVIGLIYSIMIISGFDVRSLF